MKIWFVVVGLLILGVAVYFMTYFVLHTLLNLELERLYERDRRPLRPVVEAMARTCRAEGRWFVAGQQDFGPWTYECFFQ